MPHPHANHSDREYPVIVTLRTKAPDTWDTAGWNGESVFKPAYAKRVLDYYRTHPLYIDKDKFKILEYFKILVARLSNSVFACDQRSICHPQVSLENYLKRLKSLKLFLRDQHNPINREWEIALRNVTDTIHLSSQFVYVDFREKIKRGHLSNFSQAQLNRVFHDNGFASGNLLPTKAPTNTFDKRILQDDTQWPRLSDATKIRMFNDLFAEFSTLDLGSVYIDGAVNFIDYCLHVIPQEKLSTYSEFHSQQLTLIFNRFVILPTAEIKQSIVENLIIFLKLLEYGTENILHLELTAAILHKFGNIHYSNELSNQLILSVSTIINATLTNPRQMMDASIIEATLVDALELCAKKNVCTQHTAIHLFHTAGFWQSKQTKHSNSVQTKIFALLKEPAFNADANELLLRYVTADPAYQNQTSKDQIVNACLDANVVPSLCRSINENNTQSLASSTVTFQTPPPSMTETTIALRPTPLLTAMSTPLLAPPIKEVTPFVSVENITTTNSWHSSDDTFSAPPIQLPPPDIFPYYPLILSFSQGALTPLLIRTCDFFLKPCEKFCRPFIFNNLKMLITAIVINLGATSLPLLSSLIAQLEGETEPLAIEWKLFTLSSMFALTLISEKLGQHYPTTIASRVILPFIIASNFFLASDTTTALWCYIANTFANMISNTLLACYDARKKINDAATQMEFQHASVAQEPTLHYLSSSTNFAANTLSDKQFIPRSDFDFYYVLIQLGSKLKCIFEEDIQAAKALLDEHNHTFEVTKKGKALDSIKFSDLSISELRNLTIRETLFEVSTQFKLLVNLAKSFSNLVLYHANPHIPSLAITDLEQCRVMLKALLIRVEEKIASLTVKDSSKNKLDKEKIILQALQGKIDAILTISNVGLLPVPSEEIRNQYDDKLQSLSTPSFYYYFITEDKLNAIRASVKVLNNLPIESHPSFIAIKDILLSRLLDFSCLAFPDLKTLVTDLNVNDTVSFLTANVSNNLNCFKQIVENSSLDSNQKTSALFNIEIIQKEISLAAKQYQERNTGLREREKGIEEGKIIGQKQVREIEIPSLVKQAKQQGFELGTKFSENLNQKQRLRKQRSRSTLAITSNSSLFASFELKNIDSNSIAQAKMTSQPVTP